MTPLRQKMIREMDLKNLSHHTRRAYLAAVTGLAKHYQRSPETITAEMIEDYLLHLKNNKDLAPESCRLILTGLRFFYTHILDQQIPVGFSLPNRARKTPIGSHQRAGRRDYLCTQQSITPFDPNDHLRRRFQGRASQKIKIRAYQQQAHVDQGYSGPKE
jgi:hypothetical protein